MDGKAPGGRLHVSGSDGPSEWTSSTLRCRSRAKDGRASEDMRPCAMKVRISWHFTVSEWRTGVSYSSCKRTCRSEGRVELIVSMSWLCPVVSTVEDSWKIDLWTGRKQGCQNAMAVVTAGTISICSNRVTLASCSKFESGSREFRADRCHVRNCSLGKRGSPAAREWRISKTEGSMR